jgi:uncharacterized protein YeaO (DUF488 family)
MPESDDVRLKRVYEPVAPGDGRRFLVERLWPRGVSREEAHLDGWLKDVAPSPALRRWFGHDPERWEEFQRRYLAELQAPDKEPILDRLASEARSGPVTLVFAARDTAHNAAVVLKQVIERRSGHPRH